MPDSRTIDLNLTSRGATRPSHDRGDVGRFSAAVARVMAAAPIALTALPLWQTAKGWVRIWDFPRVQIAALGVVAFGVLVRRRRTPVDGALLVAVGASLVYQGAKILPYTPLYPRQVSKARTDDPARRIRLLMVNVLQENRRADLVIRCVQDALADVVCFVETDAWWQRQLTVIERDYPWRHACPLGNEYGMLLYSRLPLVECVTRFVVEPDVPSMRAVVRLRSGEDVVIHALHPRPPLPNTSSYGRDAELVLTGQEIREAGCPAIVIGDLNDVAWSHTTALFQRISQMVDPRVGRGMFNSFHAEHPLARYPLDHVFHTRDFTVRELRRLRYTGSDHFPIFVELAFSPARKADQPKPEHTRADEEEAEAIVDAGARP